jgi:hypothetical protein
MIILDHLDQYYIIISILIFISLHEQIFRNDYHLLLFLIEDLTLFGICLVGFQGYEDDLLHLYYGDAASTLKH